MDDFEETIVSQYGTSASIGRLIENFQAYIDPMADINSFYNLVWNVDTAQGYGLDVWGRIVGVNRVLQVAVADFFGFSGPSGRSGKPYNQAPFYSGASPVTSNYALSDTAFRNLIYAKALSNISDGSIPSINRIMMLLLPGRGNAYVVDGGDMTMIYRFDFALTKVEVSTLLQSGILPRPAGVQASFIHL